MPATTDREAQLNRAYVQSQVIEAGLQHLSDTLSRVDRELHHDLSTYAVRFDEYVRRLRDERDRGEREDRRATA